MISVNKRIKAGSVLAALALGVTACSSDESSDPGTTSAAPTTAAVVVTTTADTTSETAVETTGDSTGETTADSTDGTGVGIDAERCAANEAVGTIQYLSSYDFSASAAILDVLVAEDQGYFDELCLDVDIKPGFATTNYSLIAANEAQFSSAGNYTEILNNSGDGADFTAIVDYGKAPIEALVTPDGGATTLADLEGKTIGVKGDLPPSIVAMLARAGLERGKDYQELSVEGFDPVVHLETGIDALPVYKSSEPGLLDAAGIAYNLFDPAEDDIPGSFGIIYTSREFADENPAVVADFARAALHGMEFALADIEAAVDISVKFITDNGNAFFLTPEGELYRWTQESKVVVDSTPDGEPVGLIDGALLDAEFEAYVEAGVWPEGAPENVQAYSESIASVLYDADGKVIWPAN